MDMKQERIEFEISKHEGYTFRIIFSWGTVWGHGNTREEAQNEAEEQLKMYHEWL